MRRWHLSNHEPSWPEESPEKQVVPAGLSDIGPPYDLLIAYREKSLRGKAQWLEVSLGLEVRPHDTPREFGAEG